ncbi:MAG: hypothetical protein DCC58_03820, partial [Chloroflexi bacterium]
MEPRRQLVAVIGGRANLNVLVQPAADEQLDEVAAAAATLRGYYIEVTGFASAEGNARANKILSDRRAQAVK